MMVTMKLLDNRIFCDEKSQVAVLDPLTMQKVSSIDLPDEGCYLYSVFNDK